MTQHHCTPQARRFAIWCVEQLVRVAEGHNVTVANRRLMAQMRGLFAPAVLGPRPEAAFRLAERARCRQEECRCYEPPYSFAAAIFAEIERAYSSDVEKTPIRVLDLCSTHVDALHGVAARRELSDLLRAEFQHLRAVDPLPYSIFLIRNKFLEEANDENVA